MEPTASKTAISDFQAAIKEILRFLDIKVDEERTTFLQTLAKMEDSVEFLCEKRNYLVRVDERDEAMRPGGHKAYVESSEKAMPVRSYEAKMDKVRTENRIK